MVCIFYQVVYLHSQFGMSLSVVQWLGHFNVAFYNLGLAKQRASGCSTRWAKELHFFECKLMQSDGDFVCFGGKQAPEPQHLNPFMLFLGTAFNAKCLFDVLDGLLQCLLNFAHVKGKEQCKEFICSCYFWQQHDYWSIADTWESKMPLWNLFMRKIQSFIGYKLIFKAEKFIVCGKH